MNTPNPLVPQGSLHGQSKGKSNFRIAVFTILAIHVVLICGFLIQGCKREPAQVETIPVEPTNSTAETFEPFTNNTTAAQDPFPTNPAADPTYAVNGTSVPAVLPGTGATTYAVSPVSTGAVPTNLTPINPGLEGTAPPPIDVPAPSGETTTHVVAKGEMLSTIAKKYRVTVRAVEDANPGINPLRLQIGQKLNIPAAAPSAASTASADAGNGDYTTYTVKSGDVLERIAKNNNTTVSAIKSANGMKTDRINVGQKLKIPKSTSAQ